MVQEISRETRKLLNARDDVDLLCFVFRNKKDWVPRHPSRHQSKYVSSYVYLVLQSLFFWPESNLW